MALRATAVDDDSGPGGTGAEDGDDADHADAAAKEGGNEVGADGEEEEKTDVRVDTAVEDKELQTAEVVAVAAVAGGGGGVGWRGRGLAAAAADVERGEDRGEAN